MKLKKNQGHTWIGWPTDEPNYGKPTIATDYQVKGIKEGDRVRIHFYKNGLKVEGAHWLASIRRLNLIERIKLPIFGRV